MTVASIRSGNLEDLEKIAEINTIVFGGTKTPDQIRAKLFLPIYENPHITSAEIDRKFVGYAMGYLEKRKGYYMWMFGVLPDYRGRGIGSAILDEQIDFARNQGYSKFSVKTSNRWRNMLRLCIKKGFDITGFKQNEWGSDSAIWMELDLRNL